MKISLVCFICVALFSCNVNTEAQEQTQNSETPVVVFQNVNVIGMEDDIPLLGQTVVIEGATISKIAPGAPYPEDALVIDGRGKYLVPGLAEMHAHIPTPDQGEELVKETMYLYLAGGVTLIRGMLGHPSHLELRSSVEDGSVLGPHIYTSGPSINGNSATSPEVAEKMVREQKAAGYDFLKLHPGIKRDVFDAIVRTAREMDIPYAGHVSRDVGIHHAIASDYASIDHLDGYVEGLVPAEKNVDPQENGFFGINFTDLVDETLLPDLIQSTIEHKVWNVPTQCLAERWAGPGTAAEMHSDQEMAYMPRATLERWVQSKNQMQEDASYDRERAQRFIDLRRRIIKELHDSGAGILLGSDAPQVFNVPGFSIQHEIEMYVAAGLTPYQALLTGTVNPAKYFGLQRSGMIKEGYIADLLLVDENPLEDIRNLAKRSGIMIRGVWLSQDNINEELGKLAAKYSGVTEK